MRLRQDKRIVALPIVIMITLSMLGVGVAHWSEIIKINGEVKTGSLQIVFEEAYYFRDNEEDKIPFKDIGNGWVDLLLPKTNPCTGRSGWQKIHVVANNTYPCYEIEFVFVIENIGTVPAHIVNYTITSLTPGYVWDPAKGAIVDEATGKEVVNLWIINLLCVQIEPEDDPNTVESEHKTKAELHVHTKQDAPECSTIEFEIEICAVNWNNG